MHVERVAGGAATRPRPAHERVAADHRVEAVDERRRRAPARPATRSPIDPGTAADRRRRRSAPPRCARPGTPASTPAPGGRPRPPGAGSSPRADRRARGRRGPRPPGGDAAHRRPAAAPVARFPRAIAPGRRRSSAHRTEGSLRIGYAAVNAGLPAHRKRTITVSDAHSYIVGSRTVRYTSGVDDDLLTLARLARLLERACGELEPPLTLAQYRLLAMIGDGADRASHLAGQLALAKPTVSATVDTLVERGLVDRGSHGDDRRVTCSPSPPRARGARRRRGRDADAPRRRARARRRPGRGVGRARRAAAAGSTNVDPHADPNAVPRARCHVEHA